MTILKRKKKKNVVEKNFYSKKQLKHKFFMVKGKIQKKKKSENQIIHFLTNLKEP